MQIFEEEFRGQIPYITAEKMYVSKSIVKAMKAKAGPEYELVFRKDALKWVFYRVKKSAGAPSADVMFMQFILPDTGASPGDWVLQYMDKLDMGDKGIKDFLRTTRGREACRLDKRIKERAELMADIERCKDKYVGRQSMTRLTSLKHKFSAGVYQ